ncbi:putrescine:proton symporter (AAT family) [Scopulibacillus darangshiensis]|uniref:Putrescine:proton symporter (AAT family) n=1 Tax=Scopulibacillus darangshiensis TaxID=442528 RepID=A0A4R2P1L2_9BACL|nr:APC family permease [Scopulibacillus darangshiensis]TCP27824.1 putrescine:proton symporter (AAT family) [Scopulibacillus darangshiensis]
MSVNEGQLKRSLKLRHVVFIGLAYMSPLAVFDTFGIVSEITNGHVPAAYILVTVAILFTAYSYGRMVKVYPSSGSAYTYTRKTINAHLGFLVGWAALLDYLFLPMINALLSSIYLSAVFPNVPAWIWILATIVITTALNLVGVKLAVIVNYLMVIIEFLVAAVFVILTIRGVLYGVHSQSFSMIPFYTKDLSFSSVLTGASILAISFLGFDAVTTLSEETIEPKKNIPKGIFIIAFIAGVFFVTVTYFMQALFPDVSVIKNIAGASPEMARYIGGTLFQSIFIAGYVVAVLACGLTQQMSASRLLYAMGRDGVLPKRFFGYVHPRSGIPVLNILLVAVLAMSAMFLDLTKATSLINFGAFAAFTFVNLSVIAYYFKYLKNRSVKSVITSIVIPLIGLGFNLYLWYNLEESAKVVGLIWACIGFLYVLYLTKFFRISPPEFDHDESASS